MLVACELNRWVADTYSELGIAAENSRMVDMRPASAKLRERSKRIMMELTRADYKKADAAFEESDRDLKSALVMVETGVTPEEATKLLKSADGHVFEAIELKRNMLPKTEATGEK